MKNTKDLFVKLIAAALLAAFAVCAFGACKKNELDVVGEWKTKVDLGPAIIAAIADTPLASGVEMDLNTIVLKDSEVTMTVTFDKDGNYKAEVKSEEVSDKINTMVDSNADAIKQAVIAYVAGEEGIDASAVTDEMVFGGYIPLPGVTDWDTLMGMIKRLTPMIDANEIAKKFTSEGKYTVSGDKLKMEGFYKSIEDFTAKLEGTTLTLTPEKLDENDPSAKLFPLVLEKTK
ncbi:MAG: hypothetical protein IJM20_07430 [Clostridia bacterium]|nr:hypothetical protein [Clostridia bacterium]